MFDSVGGDLLRK